MGAPVLTKSTCPLRSLSIGVSVNYPGSWCTLAIRVCVLLGVAPCGWLKIGPPLICVYMTGNHPGSEFMPFIIRS